MSRLITVPATPEFEKKLLKEIGIENIRAELRAALNAGPASAPALKRKHRSTHAARPAPKVHLEDFKSLIVKAGRKAGTDVRRFCEILDKNRVPVLPAWGPRTWVAAYSKPELRTRIRGVKHRLCPAA
jgi:hypothetical protein